MLLPSLSSTTNACSQLACHTGPPQMLGLSRRDMSVHCGLGPSYISHAATCLVLYSKRSRLSVCIRSSLQPTMSLAVSDSLLSSAVNARRRLHRRSSCPSIPRSVSTCSSVWGFDPSCGEVETYMAPLFRGLEGAQEETAKPISANQPDDFKPREKSPPDDDAVSENLSNYHFDIDGDEHNSSEQPDPSATEANQSPAPVRDDPPVTPKPQVDRPARPRPLLLQTPPVPGQLRPLVLAEAAIKDVPITGTRPLRIDRSKKRQEQSSVPQRPPRADVLYMRPPVRPIHRAATQVNLREAYRRASPHSARTVQTRHIPIARPPPFGPLPEIPNVNKVLTDNRCCVCRLLNLPCALQLVPVATLFPTGLIPLEHAQDKFKHAHCLDRLPPLTQNQSNIAKTPTSATGNHSPRTLGWSFGRAFRKQKA